MCLSTGPSDLRYILEQGALRAFGGAAVHGRRVDRSSQRTRYDITGRGQYSQLWYIESMCQRIFVGSLWIMEQLRAKCV